MEHKSFIHQGDTYFTVFFFAILNLFMLDGVHIHVSLLSSHILQWKIIYFSFRYNIFGNVFWAGTRRAFSQYRKTQHRNIKLLNYSFVNLFWILASHWGKTTWLLPVLLGMKSFTNNDFFNILVNQCLAWDI